MGEEFSGLLIYCIPALVTGAIAFLFFREHTNDENKRRNFLLRQQQRQEVLPIKLQAYERLTLFLERITPHHLLKRVSPISDLVQDYKDLLIKTIEQEYEHNLSQQIYVSDPCWRMLSAAKNSNIQIILALDDKAVGSATEARPILLDALSKSEITPEKALAFLKSEIATELR